ncbi:ectoine/hydroxyectoine ABC transporter permease subunit EhuD [Pigmentiphaga soli]|uniref:Ectoine/hydroxyectoine ABC transporter permease subunit EhuD n=1 Tax=Pigmentiphaga soli TaxID=1007095 RepID=A0ABP8GW85_9BURK
MNAFSWDWAYALSLLPRLARGLELTVLATLAGSLVAAALGFVWTMVRIWRLPVLSQAASGAVIFLRGTPLIVQLFFWFYVLPLAGLKLSPLTAGILALGIYYSSYMSEIYRAGLEAVPPGQWEACLVLSLPLPRVWLGVILPQIARIVTPMLATYVIVMFKESALLSTITVTEMFWQAMDAGYESFRFVEPITMAGILYWLISYPLAILFRYVERRFA